MLNTFTGHQYFYISRGVLRQASFANNKGSVT